MAIRLGKRGIFFTAISLLIVGLMLLSFMTGSTNIATMRMEVEQNRVDLANDLVININEAFIPRLLTVSAYRALDALAFYVSARGETIKPAELNGIFASVISTGNFSSGHPIDQETGYLIMENYSLADNLKRLKAAMSEGHNIEANFNYSKTKVIVYQSNTSGPDNIIVNLTMEYSVDCGIAQWNINKSWSVQVPVEGLYDPLWLYYEGKKIPINFAEYQVNYSKNWTDLRKFIDNINYLKEPDGPSYLMRLTGNLNSSKCCGIESPVNPKTLNFNSEYWGTYIDYCLYSNRCAPGPKNLSLYEMDNITNHTLGKKFYGYKLDPRHYVKFGIANSTGSDRHAGSGQHGKGSITLINCKINETNWLSSNQAQWHSSINGTRARCQHTEGNGKIAHVGFKLRNIDHDVTLFDVSDSTLNGDGMWYYEGKSVHVTYNGEWSLKVTCEDIYGVKTTRNATWLVP